MKPGFFQPGELTKQPPTLTVLRQAACGACGLYKHCLSPKMPVSGQGKRKILVVGESPGEQEDYQGRAFVGRSGEELRVAFRRAGASLSEDCWITNSLICRPKANKLPKDPTKLIEHCRPNVLRAIRDLKPEVIILLGAVPVQSVIGWLWKEDVKGIKRWAGWQIPSMRLNAWICPTFHPAFLLRERKRPDRAGVADALFQSHLEAALSLKGRPYDPQPPDLSLAVRKVYDPEQAADHVHRFMDAGRAVSFDYETDRLKPDHPDSRIVCCAVSDGATSVAYPWHGEAVRATKGLLLSDLPKVGYSSKFEERWTSRHLGVGVRNWALDGMLAAHCLDNRTGTKSLKFQAFVRLGAEAYDEAIKPYLAADGGNERNRVHELSLDKVLHYCGLDALYEMKLGMLLAPQVGVRL